MPIAELPSVQLYHERRGTGPRLLFVNGTGTDLRRPPSPLDWPFAADFDVLVYDHRGLGRSEPRDPDHQPTMADFAGDALALCDLVGWDSFSVLGVSFGGWSARRSRSGAGTGSSASCSRARRAGVAAALPTPCRRRSG